MAKFVNEIKVNKVLYFNAHGVLSVNEIKNICKNAIWGIRWGMRWGTKTMFKTAAIFNSEEITLLMSLFSSHCLTEKREGKNDKFR